MSVNNSYWIPKVTPFPPFLPSFLCILFLSFLLSSPPSLEASKEADKAVLAWKHSSTNPTKANPPCAGTSQLQKPAVYEGLNTAGVNPDIICEPSQLSWVQTMQKEGLCCSPVSNCQPLENAAPARETHLLQGITVVEVALSHRLWQNCHFLNSLCAFFEF